MILISPVAATKTSAGERLICTPEAGLFKPRIFSQWVVQVPGGSSWLNPLLSASSILGTELSREEALSSSPQFAPVLERIRIGISVLAHGHQIEI
ncbi:hypothetical protein F4X86_04040 [Candidatus Saccharibacteria bacterium]|nr:hypothetical protein [Candidatus Saccharibacteria bacterium]